MITFGTMRGGISQMMFSRDGSHLFMVGNAQSGFESFEFAIGTRIQRWIGEGKSPLFGAELLAVFQDHVLFARFGRIIRFDFLSRAIDYWPPVEPRNRIGYYSTNCGDVIIGGSGDRFARIDPISGAVAWSPQLASPVESHRTDVSPRGEFIIECNRAGLSNESNDSINRIRLYRTDTSELFFDSVRLPAAPYAVAVSWDSTCLAAGVGQSLYVFRLSDGRRQVFKGSKRRLVQGLQFISGDRRLLLYHNETSFQTIDVGTGEVISELDPGIGRIRSLVVSPDRTMAAASGSRNKVAIWDLEP